ncbi:DNA damage-regulated autophagy modulator protein 1-like isoform X1 [Ornithorhynchus anatinus]|uniref:DNA damage-regulated autophagy modulator protein 1-like isoform X1 n=1 Tax=Ornithorhynchus anatinus TaxID=9258 RepID=UPI0010A89FCE|nr:DNA damage-regulated autophagy modulator protein 1-like isoform X1 [Ornithorhynchus anatinus]
MMLRSLKAVALLPLALVIWSSAAFIISYGVAVLKGHVDPLLPFISDIGTTSPESCIFGFMINISAFLGTVTIYLKFKMVKRQTETSHFISPMFNIVSSIFGLVSCVGMCIVANFQELAVPLIHDGGALLTFVCGVIYVILVTVISCKACPQWSLFLISVIRIIISVVSYIAVVLLIVGASLISILNLKLNTGTKAYLIHHISAISEWIVAFNFLLFFLTFIPEFQVGIYEPR